MGVDPKLRVVVEKHSCRMFSPEGLREVVDPFVELSSGIIGQQVCCGSFVLFIFLSFLSLILVRGFFFFLEEEEEDDDDLIKVMYL